MSIEVDELSRMAPPQGLTFDLGKLGLKAQLWHYSIV